MWVSYRRIEAVTVWGPCTLPARGTYGLSARKAAPGAEEWGQPLPAPAAMPRTVDEHKRRHLSVWQAQALVEGSFTHTSFDTRSAPPKRIGGVLRVLSCPSCKSQWRTCSLPRQLGIEHISR